MAKITKDQVKRMYDQLFNGFQPNIQQLVMGEKMACKKVVLDERNYLLASLWFGAEYESYRKVSNTIELTVALYTKESPDSEVSVSHGLGYNMTLEKGLPRKTWKQLASHSEPINEAFILDLYSKHSGKMKEGSII